MAPTFHSQSVSPCCRTGLGSIAIDTIPTDLLATAEVRRQLAALWEITQPDLYFHGHWHSKQVHQVGERRVVDLGADPGPTKDQVAIVDTSDMWLAWLTEDQVS